MFGIVKFVLHLVDVYGDGRVAEAVHGAGRRRQVRQVSPPPAAPPPAAALSPPPHAGSATRAPRTTPFSLHRSRESCVPSSLAFPNHSYSCLFVAILFSDALCETSNCFSKFSTSFQNKLFPAKKSYGSFSRSFFKSFC